MPGSLIILMVIKVWRIQKQLEAGLRLRAHRIKELRIPAVLLVCQLH
jgi:hypothetical protein